MSHDQKLLQLYKQSLLYNKAETRLPRDIRGYCDAIVSHVDAQKGVFTVLVTLSVHKILHPKQDIRYHQAKMTGGFSGRTIDTNFITPTLSRIGFPHMAESGWLTRSLEQPFPYDLNYPGKVRNKQAFLNIVAYIQNGPTFAEEALIYILSSINDELLKKQVKITRLQNAEKLSIDIIIELLVKHFRAKYKTHGGSKLPVLAFYSIFQIIIKEFARYKDCTLGDLGSHTASDRRSKTAGDIEIFRGSKLLEAIEIKHDVLINEHVVRIAKEKILKHHPSRYYILSFIGIKNTEITAIKKIIADVQNQHGCQIIVDGIIDTIKYYLRLIGSLENFISNYTTLVESDTELQQIHKEKLNSLLTSLIKS